MTTQQTELVVTRVYDASKEQIWEAFTDPNHLHKFFGPKGTRIPIETVTMDVRVGGEFSLKMINEENGDEYPMSAEYVTVEAPTKLGFKTSGGIEGTIELEDLGMGKTLLTWTTVTEMDEELRRNATIGTHSAVDNLGELLKSLN